jgi:hypothetical protein
MIPAELFMFSWFDVFISVVVMFGLFGILANIVYLYGSKAHH